MEQYIIILRVCYLYNRWPHPSIEYSKIFNNYSKALTYAKQKCYYHENNGCLWRRPYIQINNEPELFLDIPVLKKRSCNCLIL